MDLPACVILDRIFGEKIGATREAFCAYRRLYELPVIRHEFEISRVFFEHFERSERFVVVAIYDQHGRIFLKETDGAKWSLPGSSIRRLEEVHEAVQRVADRSIPGIKIGEIEPVAHVENIFRHGERVHTHEGVAFIARIRNLSCVDLLPVAGRLVTVDEQTLGDITVYANQEVVRRCVARLGGRQTEIQEEEIETNEASAGRYAIHRHFAKRFILTDRRKRKAAFLDLLASKIFSSGALLDAACGDAETVNQLLARHPDIPLAVANDISWSQVCYISKNHSRLIFTNHDATNLPFKDDAFATALCSNTLHHMPSRKHMVRLFMELSRVSRRIVFVEIENPKETGGFPYYLNKYWYGHFLMDVGGAYLSCAQFQGILTQTFGDTASIEFDSFHNFQGNYLFATVTKR